MPQEPPGDLEPIQDKPQPTHRACEGLVPDRGHDSFVEPSAIRPDVTAATSMSLRPSS